MLVNGDAFNNHLPVCTDSPPPLIITGSGSINSDRRIDSECVSLHRTCFPSCLGTIMAKEPIAHAHPILYMIINLILSLFTYFYQWL